MNRFSRINTIWRKELVDTLRDRRTLIAMVVVPMVLYPALLLGSMQAVEAQMASLHAAQYRIVVSDTVTAQWLLQQIDSDPARRTDPTGKTAEQIVEEVAERPSARGFGQRGTEPARDEPPAYQIMTLAELDATTGVVAESETEGEAEGADSPRNEGQATITRMRAIVDTGHAEVAVAMSNPSPGPESTGSTRVAIYYDESDIRSDIAAKGVAGILERVNAWRVEERLGARGLDLSFIRPIAVATDNIATPQKMASSALGQIIPLILIIMTITGAIYPAIDLTAGERERGTLETLMVAPTPTMDLIAGKFIVVTLIGILSAVLNLLSIGLSVYFGGIGDLFAQGMGFVLPLSALPWIFLLLLPLAVMFSAMLLAVCSFARSFKEAQNYIVPVMIAAMIPAVVGILPGTRLEGPIVVMPVANIVVLTRELFLSRFDYSAIFLVALSTSLYAGAAVAIAARLFGQEAVLFADSGSVKTLFQRRFFKAQAVPSVAQALLITTLAYTLNYYMQQSFAQSPTLSSGVSFLYALGTTLFVVLVIGPWCAARYTRTNPITTFRLRAPGFVGVVSALLIGLGTWALTARWGQIQQKLLPFDPQALKQIAAHFAWIDDVNIFVVIAFMAIIPAFCEELFFRGYLLSGLERPLRRAGAIVVSAFAFGLFHYTLHKMAGTITLGLLLGLLAVQFRSIWPPMIVHMMHNGISLAVQHPGAVPFIDFLSRFADGLRSLSRALSRAFPRLGRLDDFLGGLKYTENGPSDMLTLICGALVLVGVCLALFVPHRRRQPDLGLIASASPEAS